MRLRAALPTHSCNFTYVRTIMGGSLREPYWWESCIKENQVIKNERIEDKKFFIYPSVKVMKIKYIGLDSINRATYLHQNA